jgi:hypothetical protein
MYEDLKTESKREEESKYILNNISKLSNNDNTYSKVLRFRESSLTSDDKNRYNMILKLDMNS